MPVLLDRLGITASQFDVMLSIGAVFSALTAVALFAHARFLKGDMHEPPLEAESADTVLFLQSLQYAADPERAIAAAGRVLRPGGRCLVLTLGEHRDERTLLEYGHLHPGFTAKRLRGWLAAAGLVVDRCELSGHDHRQPQLPILLAHAHHPGQGGST